MMFDSIVKVPKDLAIPELPDDLACKALAAVDFWCMRRLMDSSALSLVESLIQEFEKTDVHPVFYLYTLTPLATILTTYYQDDPTLPQAIEMCTGWFELCKTYLKSCGVVV